MKRAMIAAARRKYGASERRACQLLGIDRSTARYRARRPADDELRKALERLAARFPRHGYQRIHDLLRREGMRVNHKRVLRVYRTAGLLLRKRRSRRRLRVPRVPLAVPAVSNHRWAADFVQDGLSTGRRIRCLTVVDVFDRRSPTIVVDLSISGARVARELDAVCAQVGYPKELMLDNGPEMTSSALHEWA